ncbi:MAG: hypothetical protein LBE35_01480 [Clostridiales bacterium]|nr:hypothetical protein [Clostridiales bacterium]
MKKFFAIILTLILAGILAGCGGGANRVAPAEFSHAQQEMLDLLAPMGIRAAIFDIEAVGFRNVSIFVEVYDYGVLVDTLLPIGANLSDGVESWSGQMVIMTEFDQLLRDGGITWRFNIGGAHTAFRTEIDPEYHRSHSFASMSNSIEVEDSEPIILYAAFFGHMSLFTAADIQDLANNPEWLAANSRTFLVKIKFTE